MSVSVSILREESAQVQMAREFSDEEKSAIAARMKALDKILASSKTKAKYKIEVYLGAERSTWKPTHGLLSFWENGSKLHGGGDAKIYMCPGWLKDPATGEVKGHGPCGAFMPDASHGQGHLFCPTCGTRWRGEEVVGEVVAKLSVQQWAPLIARYYARLECNADICLKYSAEDIRTKALLEQQRQKGGEVLDKFRYKRLRAAAIYPLTHIIKDTGGGQDLAQQIYKFLRA